MPLPVARTDGGFVVGDPLHPRFLCASEEDARFAAHVEEIMEALSAAARRERGATQKVRHILNAIGESE